MSCRRDCARADRLAAFIMIAGTLLIRADAGAAIGAGHVMRCLALAQAWRSAGGEAVFARAGENKLDDRLRAEGCDVANIHADPGTVDDAEQTVELYRQHRASWLAVDGFQFLPKYCARVGAGPRRLLLFDDDGSRAPYRCDVVLNMNPQASESMYVSRDPAPQVLAGARYALLRQEFLKLGPAGRAIAEIAQRILVTFGGADPHNVTLKVLRALREISSPRLEVTAIVGVSNPHRAGLEEEARKSPHEIRLLSHVEDMAQFMSEADLAITAGGGTCFELAFMRVPMFLLTMAANHERTVEAYGKANAAIAAGWFDKLETSALSSRVLTAIRDRQLRVEIVANAAEMVDGGGPQRVVDAMSKITQKTGEATARAN
jgi:UDP-2,4-diacetamido-2,4,6-trideoxy-beta-L-altropyranose hydrolase